MAKKKVVKKQPAKKPTQTQTQNVNVYYDSRAGAKRKPRKRQPKKDVMKQQNVSILPAPVINYPPQFVAPNNPNWFTPPPVSQSLKQYAVLPESETAALVNLNSIAPIPLKIETELLNAPVAEPNLVELAPPALREEPFIASAPSFEDDISVLTEAPEFENLPLEAEGQILDLPPAEAAALVENKEPLFDPFNLPVPASRRSLAESIAEPPSEAGFSYPYSEEGLSLPQSQFLGGPNILFLPPIKAEKSEVPILPLAPSGLTLAPVEKSTKLEGLITETEEEQRTAKGRKIRGPNLSPALRELKKREEAERKKAERKEKKDREKGASLFEFIPTTANIEPLGIPIQIGLKGPEEGLKFSPPLSQLEGQYQFIGQPKPPTEKEQGGLERRRGGGVLSGSEAAFLAEPPAFLAQPAFIA